METIKKILADIRPEFDFESSTDFIEDGYLDSFDLVTLVAELDETYGISTIVVAGSSGSYFRKISCLSKQLLRLLRKMEDHYDCYI